MLCPLLSTHKRTQYLKFKLTTNSCKGQLTTYLNLILYLCPRYLAYPLCSLGLRPDFIIIAGLSLNLGAPINNMTCARCETTTVTKRFLCGSFNVKQYTLVYQIASLFLPLIYVCFEGIPLVTWNSLAFIRWLGSATVFVSNGGYVMLCKSVSLLIEDIVT